MTPPRSETLSEEEAVVVDAIRHAKEETARTARVSNDQVRQYLEQVNYSLTESSNSLLEVLRELQANDRKSVNLRVVEDSVAEAQQNIDQNQSIIYALLR